MHEKFDLANYRASRLARPDDDPQVFQDMFDGLANRENLALWAQGIFPSGQSASSAHFEGFRQAMIERATMECSIRGKDRSLVACVEHVLDPSAVQDFVKEHDPSEQLDIKFDRRADTFLRNRARPFVAKRPSPSR